MELGDAASHELLSDGRLIGRREACLDLLGGRLRDAPEDRCGVVVPCLQALEVEDGDAAETLELSREADIDDGVHGGGEDGDRQLETGDPNGGVHVRGLDGARAGRQRDVIEAVGSAQGIDPGGSTGRAIGLPTGRLRTGIDPDDHDREAPPMLTF
jgi:hypothetical protein